MYKDAQGRFVEEESDKKFFAELACRLPVMLGGGHKRGKKGGAVDGLATYQCPRCKATWTRKVKA